MEDYWELSGGIAIEEARRSAASHGFNLEIGRLSRFENLRNAVVIARADLRDGKVNRVLLAEEIQHGLDRATDEASRSARRGATLNEFHADVFERVVRNSKAGRFGFLTADDLLAIITLIGRLRRRT